VADGDARVNNPHDAFGDQMQIEVMDITKEVDEALAELQAAGIEMGDGGIRATVRTGVRLLANQRDAATERAAKAETELARALVLLGKSSDNGNLAHEDLIDDFLTEHGQAEKYGVLPRKKEPG
jgi:hypothetical protein